MLFPYHIGCAGWALPEWVGPFFAKGTKSTDFLEQYAATFPSVEGNTTFYRVPTPETVSDWMNKVPEGFKFCFKLPRDATHASSGFLNIREAVEFLDLFLDYRTKLGPFLVQFPASISPELLDEIEAFLGKLPRIFSYALEVRHPGFFDQGNNEHALVAMLKRHGVNRMIFDARRLHQMQSSDPGILEEQKMKPNLPVRFDATGRQPVVRFIGGNDTLNNEPYLKEWAIIVAEWIKEGKHPYFFCRTPDQVSQPQMCLFFHNLLRKFSPIPELPDFPCNRGSHQLDLF